MFESKCKFLILNIILLCSFLCFERYAEASGGAANTDTTNLPAVGGPIPSDLALPALPHEIDDDHEENSLGNDKNKQDSSSKSKWYFKIPFVKFISSIFDKKSSKNNEDSADSKPEEKSDLPVLIDMPLDNTSQDLAKDNNQNPEAKDSAVNDLHDSTNNELKEPTPLTHDIPPAIPNIASIEQTHQNKGAEASQNIAPEKATIPLAISDNHIDSNIQDQKTDDSQDNDSRINISDNITTAKKAETTATEEKNLEKKPEAPLEEKASTTQNKPLNLIPRQATAPLSPPPPTEEVKQDEATPTNSKTIIQPIPQSIPSQQKAALDSPKDQSNEELNKFIRAEVILLSFPDDDVVLGKITDESRIENMGYYQYLQLYEKYRRYVARIPLVQNTQIFIDLHRRIDGDNIPILSKNYLWNESVRYLESGKLENLRALVNNYNTLNLEDTYGNSLLHIAAISNDVYMTKWLIMRGINVNAMNNDFVTAKDIAEYEQYWGVFNILESANAQ